MKSVKSQITTPECRKIRGRVLGVRMALALTVLAPSLTEPCVGDQAIGCANPTNAPNPMCFLLPGGTSGCVKWVHNPDPSTCDGPAGSFVCFDYTVTGTVTIYTHPGTTDADCGCDSSGWVQDGDPKSTNIHEAYNNDTQCYGG
jgi:hypothetical protein